MECFGTKGRMAQVERRETKVVIAFRSIPEGEGEPPVAPGGWRVAAGSRGTFLE